VNRPLSGEVWRRTAIIHRTARWCTGLSGESDEVKSPLSGIKSTANDYKFTGLSGGAPDCLVSQRSAAQSARDAWPSQWSDGGTGLSGEYRTVSDAPMAPSLQRSTVPSLEGDPHRTVNSGCPVVHRTVRSTTRQKASIAFQLGFQRLLGPLGL
jgi:hypothetical protein